MSDREKFIHALAVMLAENAAYYSIMIEMAAREGDHNSPMYRFIDDFRALRDYGPIRGYMSVTEAEREMKKFLKGGS